MLDFEVVYRTYFPEVELYLRALCGNDMLAEELTAQTFFCAMNALPNFRGESGIGTWLCSIGKNCYRNYLRKSGRTEDLGDTEPMDSAPSLEERLLNRDQAMRIHRVLHTLPEPYREVFSLRVFGELSFGDIASIFGKTSNWACVTYHRAKEKIKAGLEK